MPLTLEVSYFNSYYVKRLADVPYIPSVAITRNATSSATIAAGQPVTFSSSSFPVVVGMFVTGSGVTVPTKVVTVTNQTTFRLDKRSEERRVGKKCD